MGILGLIVGIGLTVGAMVHADTQFNYSVPATHAKALTVSKINAVKVTNIYYANDLSGAYITRVNDGINNCYIIPSGSGTAISCK